MKKFMIALVAILALAIAAPAFAAEAPGPSVVVGGRLWTDFGYGSADKDANYAGIGKDYSSIFLNVNSNTYLNAKWTSADKTTGGLFEINASSKVNRSTSIGLRYAYGWWKSGACKFVAGHTDSWIGSLAFAPRQYLGTTQEAKVLLINWGFLYSGRRPLLRFEMFTSKSFGFSVSLVSPESEYQAPTYQTFTGAANYYNFPAIELAVMFKAGGFLIMPGVGWSQVKFDFSDASPQKSFDDSYDAWIIQLPIKWSAGAFTVKAQGYYGYNVDSVWGQEAVVSAATGGRSLISMPLWDANGKVEDTMTYGGSLEFSFKFNKLVGLHVGGGVVNYENDKLKKALGYKNQDQTRYAMFVSVPFQLTQNFDLAPEFAYYNFGDNPQTGDSWGNAWLLGVTFRFIF